MHDEDADPIAAEPALDFSRPLAWEAAARRRLNSQVVVLGVFVFLGLGLLFSPLILWVTRDIGKERRFDRQVWIDAEGDTENIRSWMADDLFRKYDFHGMTRLEVEAILGPSKIPSPLRPDEAFVYWCGPDRGFGIDSEWVYFKVDAEGKVIDYGLTGD